MKNVPDWMLGMMRQAVGDLPIMPDVSRWGKVKALSTQLIPPPPIQKLDHLTFVSTDYLPIITPIAVELRFSLDGVTYTPQVPPTSGSVVQVKLTEAIDQKTGAFIETFLLNPGDRQSFCTVLAKQLTIDVQLIGEEQLLWIAVIAAPVQTADCGDITGNPGGDVVSVAGYSTSGPVLTYQASTFVFPGTLTLLAPNANRRQFYVQNNSDTDLGLLLDSTGPGPSWTPGSERLSLIVPGGGNLAYESFVGCYRGVIKGSMRPGGGTPVGFIGVTEGTP